MAKEKTKEYFDQLYNEKTEYQDLGCNQWDVFKDNFRLRDNRAIPSRDLFLDYIKPSNTLLQVQGVASIIKLFKKKAPSTTNSTRNSKDKEKPVNDKGLRQSTSIEDMDSNNETEVTTEEKKEQHNRKDEEKLVNSKQ